MKYEEYFKDIFPEPAWRWQQINNSWEKVGKVWTNPYTGWLYEYKFAEGWICIRGWIEE